MGWFGNLKIRSKLLILFGVFSCTVLLLMAIASSWISSIGNEVGELLESVQARQGYITEATEDVYKIRLANISNGYLAGDGDYAYAFSRIQEHYAADAESLKLKLEGFRNSMTGDPRFKEIESEQLLALESIESTLAYYIGLANQVEVAVENKDKAGIVRLYQEAVPVGNQLTSEVRGLSDHLFDTTMTRMVEISESADMTISRISAVKFIVLAIAILAFLLAARYVTRDFPWDISYSVNRIRQRFSQRKPGGGTGTEKIEEGSSTYLFEKLSVVFDACGEHDQTAADDAAIALIEKGWPPAVTKKLYRVVNCLVDHDLETAATVAEEIMIAVWEDRQYGMAS